VQHRTILGDIDVFAGQHRVSAIRQADWSQDQQAHSGFWS
jgi:hypothetical protein